MNKAQDYPYKKQIKQLTKKFKVFDHFNTKLLFQYCEFDKTTTAKVLKIAEEDKTPMNIIKRLIDSPEKSELIIESLVEKHDKYYGKYIEQDNQTKQQSQIKSQKQINKLDFDFFTFVPDDVISNIFNFLDPYSLVYFSLTNTKIYQLTTKPELLNDYYRRLCSVLFKSYQPSLPEPTRFNHIKEYVLAHPNEFTPNTRNLVNNNLRYYIWKMQATSFKLDKNYYLSFGNYQNLFYNCPRIHFNGYYICKYRYVKVGEKTFTNSFAPIHIIYYYRYFRFLHDGSVIYRVSTKKIKPEKIAEELSIKNLNKTHHQLNEQQSIIGEYIQHSQTVYLKVAKGNSIYGYELEIKSKPNKISNQLLIKNYTLELVDQTEIVQKLYTWSKFKEEIFYEYIHNDEIAKQNSFSIQATSL